MFNDVHRELMLHGEYGVPEGWDFEGELVTWKCDSLKNQESTTLDTF